MDTKAHYTLVGLMVIILLAGLLTSVIWLSMGLNRPTYNIFLLYMNQSVVGLNDEAAVKFNGVDVGYVKKMELNPKNPQQVIVQLEIKAGTPITTSTVATLAAQGITGLNFISLSAQTPNAPLVEPTTKPPYPVIPTQPSLLVQMSSLIKDTSTQIQSMTNSVQNVLNAENAANLKKILINLNTVTTALAHNSQDMTQILQQANIALTNTANASMQFPNLTTNLQSSISNLNQATNLAKQGMIPMIHLINRLTLTTANLESFSNDLKQNPAILLRGKAENNLGPGE